MGLPTIPRRTTTIDIGGESFTISGLSRAEVLAMPTPADKDDTKLDEVSAFEVYLIEKSMDVTHDEAVAWHAATDSEVVDQLTTEIARFSGMRKDENDRDPKPDTSGTS